MSGELSEDGEWMWNGTEWVPVPEESSPPATSDESGMSANPTALVGLVGAIFLLIGAFFLIGTSITLTAIEEAEEKGLAYQEAYGASYSNIFVYCDAKRDFSSLCEEWEDRKMYTAYPAIFLGSMLILFDNRAKFQRYFRYLLGITETVAEPETKIENTPQNQTSEVQHKPDQEHVNVEPQQIPSSIQDSVVSGDIHYNIIQSASPHTGPNNSTQMGWQNILTAISIVLTIIGLFMGSA